MLDFSQLINNWGLPLLALVLTGLVGWLVIRTSSWLDAHASFLNTQQRAKIVALEQSALNAGVNYALNIAKASGEKIHPQVNSWILRNAAQVAIDHADGILVDNGASPDQIAARILAHLPDNVISTDTTGSKVKTTTVTVETLPPIELANSGKP